MIPSVGVSIRGKWRLRLALKEVVSRRVISGQRLSRIIGHYTFRELLRRELLSALGSV